MSHNFRNSRMATTAKFAGAVLIPVMISAGTAAADDISEVNVTNSGKLPVKVVILNITWGELGRTSSPDFISGSGGSGKVTLKKKVNQYHWEAFALGPDGRQDKEPCDSDHKSGVSAPSIKAQCDHTMAGQTPAPAAAPPPAAAAAAPANKTIRASFSNVPPRPDDLKAMSLKESDAEMTVEYTDLVAHKTERVPLPVGVKTIELAIDASGSAHLSYKIFFRGAVCFSGSKDGSLGADPAGKVGRVVALQLRSIKPPTCALQM